MHDLSDAFCIVGPQSQAKKIGGISTSAVELRSDDGETKLSLNPASGAINGTAPGGFNLNGLKILSDGRLQLVDGSIVDKHTHGGVEPRWQQYSTTRRMICDTVEKMTMGITPSVRAMIPAG